MMMLRWRSVCTIYLVYEFIPKQTDIIYLNRQLLGIRCDVGRQPSLSQTTYCETFQLAHIKSSKLIVALGAQSGFAKIELKD